MPSPGSSPHCQCRRSIPGSSCASASESDGGTRLSFPSTAPGREVFQTNTAIGLDHVRAPLPARPLRSPCPADRWSSRAPTPPSSSRPFSIGLPSRHLNGWRGPACKASEPASGRLRLRRLAGLSGEALVALNGHALLARLVRCAQDVPCCPNFAANMLSSLSWRIASAQPYCTAQSKVLFSIGIPEQSFPARGDA